MLCLPLLVTVSYTRLTQVLILQLLLVASLIKHTIVMMKARHLMKLTFFHTEIAQNVQVQHLSHMDTKTKNANLALISNKI